MAELSHLFSARIQFVLCLLQRFNMFGYFVRQTFQTVNVTVGGQVCEPVFHLSINDVKWFLDGWRHPAVCEVIGCGIQVEGVGTTVAIKQSFNLGIAQTSTTRCRTKRISFS